MAAWSLILQAELDEIAEMGLQSSWLSSEEMMAKVLAENRSDSPEGRGHQLCIAAGGAYLPNRNPRDQVFEGERPFSPWSRASLGGQHGD